MKTRIFVLLALFVGLVVFPGLASGEAREVESASSSSAMFNPLTYVETHYDLGLDSARSVAISLDGKHVYAAGCNDKAIVAFSRDSATGMLAFVEEEQVNGCPTSIAISLDGKHVYVTSRWDHAVTVFSRDPSTGALTFVEEIQDGGSVDGLLGAESVAVSSDGDHVYVAGKSDNAVAIFSRSVITGGLIYKGMVKDGVGADGLAGASSVTVSLDGDHVYVAGQNDDAVAIFSRDGDTLTYEGVVKDGGSVDGLDGATSVTVSPDGAHVYVASLVDDAVAIFSRDGDTLTYRGVVKDGGSVDGLDGARAVVVSPFGDHVYVAGKSDDAVAIFSRDGSTLTYEGMVQDEVGASGLDGARSVIVSPDDDHVYVASEFDDAVAIFSRDDTAGVLTFLQMWQSAEGLDGAIGAAVSPDGSHLYVTGNDGAAVVAFERNGATGALIFVERDYGSAINTMEGARAVAIDPDGDNVYVAGFDDDVVTVFSRNASGGYLTFVEMVVDGFDGVDGLNGPQALTVSPDGKHVYVASQGEDAVAIFGRDGTTGMLTYAGVVRDDSGPVDGLDGAYAIAITADGKHVYVAGYVDDAVAVFERDATSGALTFKFVYKDTDPLVNGLNGANDLALSPDGEYLYVASRAEDAVAVFQRVPSTGALFEVGVWRDGVSGVDGLNGARAVAVSPDGSQVYVASQVANALAVFARDAGSGELLFVGMHQNNVDGVEGLDTANGLAVSPDGGHVYVTGYDDDAVAVFARWRVYLPLVVRD